MAASSRGAAPSSAAAASATRRTVPAGPSSAAQSKSRGATRDTVLAEVMAPTLEFAATRKKRTRWLRSAALLFPVAGLGLILWLTHLEETLPRDVATARRRPPPPPILAIPVRRVATLSVVTIPQQRRLTEAELSEPGSAMAV